VPNIERQLEKLRRLRAPKGDEDVVRTIWDDFAAGLAKIKARHAPPGRPPAEIKAAQRRAPQYGFKVCGTT
jgi:hypothetical protein